MAKVSRKDLRITQRVFEARYERGYRYLDRCGEALVILEELLPSETGTAWMTEEAVPTGARLKCPDLDLIIIFDTARLVVEQQPADVPCDFDNIASTVLSTISARFDLRVVTRFGARRFARVATDSIEQAEELAVKWAPFSDWPVQPNEKFVPVDSGARCVFENEDRNIGFRFSINSVHEIDAPVGIDKRLLQPPRLLPKGQRKALLDQLLRKKQRKEASFAGIVIDIDYYAIRPENVNAKQFLEEAWQKADQLTDEFLSTKRMP